MVRDYIQTMELHLEHNRPYRAITYLCLMASFLLLLSLFIGIGFVLDIVESFVYVGLSINTSIFGSLLVASFTHYKDIKEDLSSKYYIRYLLVMDGLRFAWIQCSVSTIVFYYVFDPIIPTYLLFVFLGSAILSSVCYIVLLDYADRYMTMEEGSSGTVYLRQLPKDILYVFVIHQYYMIVLHIHIVDNIVIGTILWTVVLALLLIGASLFKREYIPGISNPFVRYPIYIILLLVLSLEPTNFTYHTEYRTVRYIRQHPQHTSEPILLDVPIVTSYENGRYVITDGIVMIDYYQIHNERIVLANEYITIDTILAREQGAWYIEAIKEIDGEYHHLLYKIVDGDFVEQYHTITSNKPEYDKQPYVEGRTGPAEVYSAEQINDQIVLRVENGYLLYNLDFELQDMIPIGADLGEFGAALERFDTDSDTHTIRHLNHTLSYDQDMSEITMTYQGTTVVLDHPVPYMYQEGGTFHPRDFVVTDNYYIVDMGSYLFTYTKDGDYVDSILFPNMKNLQTTYVDENELVTVYASYYDVLFKENTYYTVYQTNPSNYGPYVFRDQYYSYLNCEDPYGCDVYNPMSQHVGIYIETFAIINIVLFMHHNATKREG